MVCKRVLHRLLPSACLLVPVLLAGCRVETHKNGENNNVDIGTPFGSMHVKTDENATAQTGLTPYPGASLVHEKDDNGSADVSMNFGGFKLGVHAVEMRTPDPKDKVLAFYRKDMGRYGAVLTCHGHDPVGEPTRTGEGLTCSSDQHNSDEDELQLRAGSPTHQHIVGVQAENGGTRVGLVALDLPSGLKSHHDDDRE